MNRRRLLTTAGAGLTGGLVATLAGTDRAAAQTSLTMDVVGDDTTLGVDESITGVRLAVDVEWAYTLPESVSPDTVIVELAAGTDDVTTVATAESPQLFAEASGSESLEADLLGDVVTASEVRNGVDMTVEARMHVENADGDVLAREAARDSATVKASQGGINATQYGNVGGVGELTIETA